MESKIENRSIQLLDVILIESHFKREITLDSSLPLEPLINFNSQKILPDAEGKFAVYLTVTFTLTVEKKVVVEISTTMSGIFMRSEGVTDEHVENFSKINGPAIVFPFIREIIASHSVRAGMNPVLIQPINFVNMAKQADEKVKAKV